MKTEIWLSFIAFGFLTIMALRQVFELRKTKRAIRSLASDMNAIEDDDRQKIINKVKQLKETYSPWTLLFMADRFSWSGLVVSCLPSLYFVHRSKRIRLTVWKEVLRLTPRNLHYTILKKYCNGQVLQIEVSENTYHVINEIALRLERARLHNPYSSYTSLIGVINQFINEFELEMKSTKNSSLADDIQLERKELLEEELHLHITAI